MKHSFPFKLIDTLNKSILDEFKVFVVNESYRISNDFAEYAIRVSRNLDNNDAIFRNFVNSQMSKYFKPGGHVGTNIARMDPCAYVPEHTDYTANTYGKMQDSIVKFQIPVITNSAAGLMWKHDTESRAACLSLVEGGIYAMDNCRVHSSVNFSGDYRYWITSRWNINSLLNSSILN